jgi:hypothetical protein
MRLQDHVVEVLRSNVSGSVEAGDLDEAYDFQHAWNASRTLEPPRTKSASVQWHINFFDKDGAASLKQPLSRSVYFDLPLFGSVGTGTVVRNEAFYPVPACRNCKLGRALYAREEKLYAKWGVREIQILANDSGPAVLIKHFGFLPQDPRALEEAYEGWARKWQPQAGAKIFSKPDPNSPNLVATIQRTS